LSQELLSVVGGHYNTTWESHPKEEHVDVELVQTGGHDDPKTSHAHQCKSSKKYAPSAIPIAQQANWNDGRGSKHSYEVGSTEEANPLLWLTKHVGLLLPVIDVL